MIFYGKAAQKPKDPLVRVGFKTRQHAANFFCEMRDGGNPVAGMYWCNIDQKWKVAIHRKMLSPEHGDAA